MRLWKTRFGGFFHFKILTIYGNARLSAHRLTGGKIPWNMAFDYKKTDLKPDSFQHIQRGFTLKKTSIKLSAAAFILCLMPPAFAKTISKEFTESVTVERTIVAVKKAERLATLRDEEGNTRTVSVGEAFQNWDRVRVGDKVKATYAIYVRGELRKPTKEEKANPLVVEVSGGTNENPNSPAASIGDKITVVTKVVAVNKDNMTATLEGPNGMQLTIQGDNPENAKYVKVGKTVIITYQERLFMSLEVMPPKQ